MGTCENILVSRFGTTSKRARKSVREARQNLGMDEDCAIQWSSELEKECISVYNARYGEDSHDKSKKKAKKSKDKKDKKKSKKKEKKKATDAVAEDVSVGVESRHSATATAMTVTSFDSFDPFSSSMSVTSRDSNTTTSSDLTEYVNGGRASTPKPTRMLPPSFASFSNNNDSDMFDFGPDSFFNDAEKTTSTTNNAATTSFSETSCNSDGFKVISTFKPIKDDASKAMSISSDESSDFARPVTPSKFSLVPISRHTPSPVHYNRAKNTYMTALGRVQSPKPCRFDSSEDNVVNTFLHDIASQDPHAMPICPKSTGALKPKVKFGVYHEFSGADFADQSSDQDQIVRPSARLLLARDNRFQSPSSHNDGKKMTTHARDKVPTAPTRAPSIRLSF